MEKFINILWIGAGGFVGSSLRYIINLAIMPSLNTDFPVATFLINIIGSFLLGIISEAGIKFVIIKPELYLMLTVGLCGGFTTFSSFIFESYNLLKDQEIFLAIFYGAISYILAFLSLYVGIILVRYVFQPGS